MDFTTLRHLITSMTVYDRLKQNPVVQAFSVFSAEVHADPSSFEHLLKQYSTICRTLYESEYEGSLPDYLFAAAMYDDNLFTRASAGKTSDFFALSKQVRKAAEFDLNVCYAMAHITPEEMKNAILSVHPEQAELVSLLPEYIFKHQKFGVNGQWGNNLMRMAEFNRTNGVGIFAQYHAFTFRRESGIIPISQPDPIRLADLKHYEPQRQKIVDNTLGFLQDKPYNNVLLYGDRGTGKSSTVKALLNEYYTEGLRIVEMPKQELLSLDRVVEQLASIPLKFILFIDDLSFSEDDPSFNILKAMLEGLLFSRPDNIAIYATTNRRHIIKETFGAREGNEVHRADTIDEALSLSDRFGLCVTFTLPNKDNYLDIVRLLSLDRGLEVDEADLFRGAEQFALSKGGRSPRLARQYVDHIEARLSLGLPLL